MLEITTRSVPSASRTRPAIIARAAVTMIALTMGCSDDPAPTSPAPEAALAPVFLSQAEGRAEISRRDDYVAAMSRFDRQSRTGSLQPLSVDEYLAAMPAHVRAFSDAERAQVTTALATVQQRMTDMGLAVPAAPAQVRFVRTDGGEEGDSMAYTRGDSVYLCDGVFAGGPEFVLHVVAHEMFHLWSRANPDVVRWPSHEALGFVRAPSTPFPASLAELRIANPDDPLVEETIRVDVDGTPTEVFLALVARSDYQGGGLFDYLQLQLIEPATGTAHALESVQGLLEQIGTTTTNVLSAEEISAEHFAIGLLQDAPIQDPALIEAVLKPFAK